MAEKHNDCSLHQEQQERVRVRLMCPVYGKKERERGLDLEDANEPRRAERELG